MGEKTEIAWTDSTWNPTRGCSRVSEGCRNCYAENVAARFSGPGQPYAGFAERGPTGPRWTGEVALVPGALELPLRWRRPRRVFVNSMSDLFHEAMFEEWIDRVFAVMVLAQRHAFQVLTKRPERMRTYLSDPQTPRRIARAIDHMVDELGNSATGWQDAGILWGANPDKVGRVCLMVGLKPWPLPNVWCGASVENRATLHRVDDLRATPAALRFLSVEPLLEDLGTLDLSEIGWVIVGGESGPGARPMDLAWARSVVAQCQKAGVPVFVKQLGRSFYDARPGGQKVRLMPDHPKGGEPEEWPEDLRVREFPDDQASRASSQASARS